MGHPVAHRSSSVAGVSLALLLLAPLACIGDPYPYYREVGLDPAASFKCVEAAVRVTHPGVALRVSEWKPGALYRMLGRKPTGVIEMVREGVALTIVLTPRDAPVTIRFQALGQLIDF